jgi:hypothetical protein
MLNNLNSMGLDKHELVPWNKIPIDSRFHSSRKLVVGFFNVLVIKQFEGLALTDVFHTSNCNMFFCNCKLISSNKICGKVERHILSKVLYGDSLDIKSLHKEYKHRYMMFKSTDATTMFCDLLNGDVYV